MLDFLDGPTLLLGLGIFAARVGDVTLATIRTLSIVQGRTGVAFVLGFFEVNLWLAVITTVVGAIAESPILALFYGLGFSTGNVVGITLERRIALGYAMVSLFSVEKASAIATALREKGYRVTLFKGEGMKGPVTEVFLLVRRRKIAEVLKTAWSLEPTIFYTTATPGTMRRRDPGMPTHTFSWRSVVKRK